jgi:hypothetical protein
LELQRKLSIQFLLINNLPAYILVCTSLSAGIQPQTAFRPIANGLGQKARLQVMASLCLSCITQFCWHGCSILTHAAILQDGCYGSHRDSDKRVQIYSPTYPPIHITGKGASHTSDQ